MTAPTLHLDNPREAFDNDGIERLFEYREGQHFDRKRKLEPKDISRHLVGFANANQGGGLLLLGVDDKTNAITGLRKGFGDDYRNKIAECRNSLSHVIPKFRFISVKNERDEEDEVGLVYVPFSSQQVATTSGGNVFLRSGDDTIELTTDQVIQLRQERGQDIPYGHLASSVELEKAQFHDGVLNDYLQRISTTASRSDLARVLLSRYLAIEVDNEVRLTKAGLLLLTQDPRYEIPGAFVRIRKYEGRDTQYGAQQNVVQDETFYGPIPVVAQRIRDYVRTQIRQFRPLGQDGRFSVETELPESAWFEVIVNALVHRSYHLINDHILIRLFDDRLEVISPGTYMLGVNPNDFREGKVSRSRNVAIMEFMRDLGYVEMIHEGTRRIFGEMAKAGLPEPKYSPPGKDQVSVTLFNDIDRRRPSPVLDDPNPPVANIFALEMQKRDEASPEESELPTFQELTDALEQAIIDGGWAVSSFTNDLALDFQSPPLLVHEVVSIYEAFRFSVQQFASKYYLVLDYKVEFRNRTTLDKAIALAPQLISSRFGRAFVKIAGKWKPCYIHKIDATPQTAVIELVTPRRAGSTSVPEQLKGVAFQDILPDLDSRALSDIIHASQSRIDVYKERDRLSQLPPVIRLQKIKAINSELQRRVFPFTVGNYDVYASLEPTKLVRPDFQSSNSLREPSISFAHQQVSKETAKGLTTFGAYEKPSSDIPIILMSSPEKMPLLEQLITRLRAGSKRFNGFRRTFGVDLQVIGKYTIQDISQYRKYCEKIVPDLPKEPLPLMLMYMPDASGLWSRGNYQSPYYQVKHYLLENGLPSQGVDQITLNDPEWKDLNLALDIFAKTGHTPWVLDEGLPLADVFIGLSYSSIRMERGIERIIAYVCVFDEFGRWQYYIGNTEPVRFEDRDKRLGELIQNAVRQYSKGALVKHVHIHHGHKMKFETSSDISNAVRRVASDANVYSIYINGNTPIRLFSTQTDAQAQVDRGTFVKVSNSQKFFLATTGKSELQSTHRGTPVVMEARLHHFGGNRSPDMSVYAQHILSLTRLNWASTRSYSAEPITLLYSSKVARLMNIFIQSYGSFSLHPNLERTPWFL